MELRHLKSFVVVAELKNFTVAARKLYVAQPAVSQQIKLLEEEIGVTLLTRNKRTVALTDAGEAFLQEATAILKRCDAAAELARRVDRGELGRLAVGYFSSASSRFLPSVIGTYRSAFPQVRVTLHDRGPNDLLEGLEAGSLDLIFSRKVPAGRNQDFVEHLVYRDTFFLALSVSHPLANRSRIKLEEVAEDEFIFFERKEAPEMVDQMMACCRQAGFSPRIAGEAKLMQSVLTFVSAGLGVAILPGCVSNLQVGGTVFRPLRPSSPPVSLNLIYRRSPRPLVEAFCEVVLSQRRSIQKMYRSEN